VPNVPLPDIAPVELMLVQVGIDAIISREVERITVAKLHEMSRIPSEIETLARKMVRGELRPSISLSDFNWRKAITELAAGWDVNQVVEMTKAFPPEYQVTGSALIVKAREVIAQLSEGLPLSQYQTFTGVKNLVPADQHIFKFSSVLEVVRNPMIVFDLMAAGALLKVQANAVRTVYPTLSAAIDAAIAQATVAAKADRKSFEPPQKSQKGIRAWCGQGPVDQAQLQNAQAAVARARQKRDARTNPPPNQPPPAQSLLTSTQKVEQATA
jgi:hypothetical protein